MTDRVAAEDPLIASRSAGHGWTARRDGADMLVSLSGDWIARETGVQVGGAGAIFPPDASKNLSFDTTALGRWDSALVVFLCVLRAEADRRGMRFDQAGLPSSARKLLALTAVDSVAPAPLPARPRLPDRVGRSVIGGWTETIAILSLVGETILRSFPALRGRAGMRGIDLLVCAREAGVDALGIVTIVNLLVGGILAFVGAVQLRRFGAGIYVANLVGIAVVREMAALMTAIVMSGRTGGAYAAHIATMQGGEEIDALRVVGIPVYDYLILPRIAALTFMMPVLYLYGCAVGILGGLIVAVATLDLAPLAFMQQTRSAVDGGQFLFGLAKSVVFGAVIAITGCRVGLRAGRSAADVGRAATTAVVIGIVSVIALDAVFAVCANALKF